MLKNLVYNLVYNYRGRFECTKPIHRIKGPAHNNNPVEVQYFQK